jgi:putative Mn2+ efflux pump MntP
MDLVVILGIAVALAMDAFAVALATGMTLGKVSGRQTFRLAFHFGLFQFLMPLVGWFIGWTIADTISGIDHWIAFVLLSFVGGRMFKEGLEPPSADRKVKDPTKGRVLILLSVATSIDALAVGLSMALLGVDIWYPSVVIGIVAAAFTLAGLRLGRLLGERFGHRMALLGGAVLIAIGVRILVGHLTGVD